MFLAGLCSYVLTAFLHSIKLSGYKIGIKLDKDPLAVERISYWTKVVNVYIAYDLDAWPKILHLQILQ